MFSFITVFAGGIALENVGWKIWIWMLLSCAVAVPFVYFMCPEVSHFACGKYCCCADRIQTTGKTLEEIDLLFARPNMQESAWARQTTHGSIASKEAVVMDEEV